MGYRWKRDKDEPCHYLNDGRFRAVARCFAEVHWWNDRGRLTVLKNPGPEEDTDEWREAEEKWKEFWAWKYRPIREGDSWTPDFDIVNSVLHAGHVILT